jgi:hypothetical protein
MGNSPSVYEAWRKSAADSQGGTWQLYVGADNKTHSINTTRLYAALDARHSGYTVAFTMGAWEAVKEQSVVVTVTGQERYVRGTARMLAGYLDQGAVGLVRIGTDMEMVSPW